MLLALWLMVYFGIFEIHLLDYKNEKQFVTSDAKLVMAKIKTTRLTSTSHHGKLGKWKDLPQ